jgi:hypothetical protein
MPEIEDAECVEVSLVDRPANKRSTLEIMKRDGPTDPWSAREAELQKAADAYTKKAFQKADRDHCELVKLFGDSGIRGGWNRSEYHEARKALFDGSRQPVEGRLVPTVAVDADYTRVMKRAAAAFDQGAFPTTEQAFAALWNTEMVQKRRSRAALPVPPNSGDTDDDSVSADPGSGDDMDDDSSGAELGPPRNPRTPAGRQNTGGTSSGSYDMNGGNTMLQSVGPPGGPPPKSYDPARRPPSATKKSKKSKLQKRAERYVHVFPDAAQALKVAALPKSLRKNLLAEATRR